MIDLVYSVESQRDLEEIGDYILGQLHNPSAALRVIRQIHHDVDALKTFPQMGTPIPQEPKENPYRYLVSGSYLVFYHTADTQVHVDRILYGRRDYAALLFGQDLPRDPEA